MCSKHTVSKRGKEQTSHWGFGVQKSRQQPSPYLSAFLEAGICLCFACPANSTEGLSVFQAAKPVDVQHKLLLGGC